MATPESEWDRLKELATEAYGAGQCRQAARLYRQAVELAEINGNRRHRRTNAPVYLLGLLDGETANIIDELKKTGRHEPNTLSETDRELLHGSDEIDLIAPIVVADLEKTAATQGEGIP